MLVCQMTRVYRYIIVPKCSWHVEIKNIKDLFALQNVAICLAITDPMNIKLALDFVLFIFLVFHKNEIKFFHTCIMEGMFQSFQPYLNMVLLIQF